MKRIKIKVRVNGVTPFVGVWIETPVEQRRRLEQAVTPFVGVWIETFGQCQKNTLGRVTPFVGVWIETSIWKYQKLNQ